MKASAFWNQTIAFFYFKYVFKKKLIFKKVCQPFYFLPFNAFKAGFVEVFALVNVVLNK